MFHDPRAEAHTKASARRTLMENTSCSAHTYTVHSVAMQREIQAHSSLIDTKTWKTTKLTNFVWLAGSDKHLFKAKKQILITCPLVMHLWEVLKAFPPYQRIIWWLPHHIIPHHFSSEGSSLHLAQILFNFFANTCCGRMLYKSTTQAGS